MWSRGLLPQFLQAEGPGRSVCTTITLDTCLPQLAIQFVVTGAAFDLYLPCPANVSQSYHHYCIKAVGNPVWWHQCMSATVTARQGLVVGCQNSAGCCFMSPFVVMHALVCCLLQAICWREALSSFVVHADLSGLCHARPQEARRLQGWLPGG